MLKADGYEIGPPVNRQGTGFSARFESEEGVIVVINAEVEADRVVLTHAAPTGKAEGSADPLAGSAEFEAAIETLGDEFAPLAFADAGGIAESFVADSSVVDVVTGEASPEAAVLDFLAGKLGAAAAGTRVEGDRLITRLRIGVD